MYVKCFSKAQAGRTACGKYGGRDSVLGMCFALLEEGMIGILK